MTAREALTILREMQLWRRGQEPYYDGEDPETWKPQPYGPTEYGEAIDVGIEAIEHWIGEK